MNKKSDIDYWKRILCSRCTKCNGSGVLEVDEESKSIQFCTCVRQARAMTFLNDPDYGLPKKFQSIKLDELLDYSPKQIKDIKKSVKGFCNFLKKTNGSPYRNCMISGGPRSGKSSVAAILFRAIISHEYEAYRVRFAEIASLSRMFYTNSQAFNEKKELYNILKNAPFLFIEDIDNRGQTDSEKMSYNFFDEIFSYRSNHNKRATIFTIDSGLTITPEFMGSCFFNQICQEDVDDDDIYKIELPIHHKFEGVNKEADLQKRNNQQKLNDIKNKNK